MIQRYKIPKLLHTAPEREHFLNELTISKTEHTQLKEIRKLIRSTLRRGFRGLREQVKSSGSDELQYISKLTPKFWTQGSFIYGTLNDPAQCPPQQIDLDDGVYFPMDVVEESPVAAKRVLLSLVEQMLKSLCTRQGWGFETKPTCFRLKINHRIHIDLPVYAIPQDRYLALQSHMQANESLFADGISFHEEVFLDPEKVYLAMHDDNEHWKSSDPMELQRWFENECQLHPRRLRRVCRYVKAWRDFTWEAGGPSSITLMVAAAETFDQHLNESLDHFSTDCQALLAVARAMPAQFAEQIRNPVDTSEVMFPRGTSDNELRDIREKIDAFKQDVEIALCQALTSESSLVQLRKIFGSRIPNRPEWVEIFQIAAAVRSLPVKQHKLPDPPKTKTMKSA